MKHHNFRVGDKVKLKQGLILHSGSYLKKNKIYTITSVYKYKTSYGKEDWVLTLSEIRSQHSYFISSFELYQKKIVEYL